METSSMKNFITIIFFSTLLSCIEASFQLYAGNYQIEKLPRTCKVEVDFIGTKENFFRSDSRVHFQFDNDDEIASLGSTGWRSRDCDPSTQGFYLQLFHEKTDFIEPHLRGKPIGPRKHYKMPETGGYEEIIEIEGRIARVFVSVHFINFDEWVHDQNRLLSWILKNGPQIQAERTVLSYNSITIKEANLTIPGFRYTCLTGEYPMSCCLCRNSYTSHEVTKNEELLQLALSEPSNEDCKCPICFEVMSGDHYPIKLNNCGHNVCKNCHIEMTSRKQYKMENLENI